jgi:hypothetical protein
MIASEGGSIWVVAVDWTEAIALWKIAVKESGGPDNAEPDMIQMICGPDDLLLPESMREIVFDDRVGG